MLHRKLLGNLRHRPRPKDGRTEGPAGKSRGHALTYAGAALIGLRGDAWHDYASGCGISPSRAHPDRTTVEGRAMGRAKPHCEGAPSCRSKISPPRKLRRRSNRRPRVAGSLQARYLDRELQARLNTPHSKERATKSRKSCGSGSPPARFELQMQMQEPARSG